jgi:hypothetical protein
MDQIVLQPTLRAYQTASEFVKLGQCGAKDHRAVNAPFMGAATPSEKEEAAPQPLAQGERIEQMLERVPLPSELCKVYRVIDRPHCEYIFGQWILMSLQHVHDQYNIRVSHDQRRAVDFAIQYMGLGHCDVCSYDPEQKRIFYRGDGGSNGFDVSRNFEHANTYVPPAETTHPFGHWVSAARKQMGEGVARDTCPRDE